MAEPTLRDGAWWVQRDDDTWLKYDDATGTWGEAVGHPPPLDDVVGAPPPRSHEPLTKLQPASPEVVERRARVTIVFLWANFALGIFAAISDLAERALIRSFLAGEGVTLAELTASDERQSGIAGLQIILIVVTAVFFLRWFSEAYRNVTRYGATQLPFSSGWAIGSWFVPVVNLFVPARIANATYRASDPDLPVPVADRWHASKELPMIYPLWWATWIASNLLGVFAQATLGESPTADDVLAASILQIGADLSAVAAAGLAVFVVRMATARQIARHRAAAIALY